MYRKELHVALLQIAVQRIVAGVGSVSKLSSQLKAKKHVTAEKKIISVS